MSKGKILIVEDEEDIRDVLKLHLGELSFKILEAGNGDEAIQILRDEDNMTNVGLIICDIRMPRVNGVECIEFLIKETPGIPVMVVTGYPDAEMASDLLNKGVKEYLVKPVQKKKLIWKVERLIAEKEEIIF